MIRAGIVRIERDRPRVVVNRPIRGADGAIGIAPVIVGQRQLRVVDADGLGKLGAALYCPEWIDELSAVLQRIGTKCSGACQDKRSRDP